jgi:hypothetical protein
MIFKAAQRILMKFPVVYVCVYLSSAVDPIIFNQLLLEAQMEKYSACKRLFVHNIIRIYT